MNKKSVFCLLAVIVVGSVIYGNRGLKCISDAEAESIYGGGYRCVPNSTCDDDVCEQYDEQECPGKNGHYQLDESAEYCTTGGTACDCDYGTGKCYKKKACHWADVGMGVCMPVLPHTTKVATVWCTIPS